MEHIGRDRLLITGHKIRAKNNPQNAGNIIQNSATPAVEPIKLFHLANTTQIIKNSETKIRKRNVPQQWFTIYFWRLL